MGSLFRLQHLDLSSNMLTGSLPSSFAGLRSLQFGFNLSHNLLQGNIPQWVGGMDKVQNISLQSNAFTGPIPPSLSRCKALIALNLSFNRLSGSIPQQLGELNSLVLLDLAFNNLSGSIPETLTSLKEMAVFNVCMNNLQGPIPNKGPFSAFNRTSFIGNPGLCGRAVNQSCTEMGYKKRKKSLSKVVMVIVVLAASLISATLLLVCALFICRMQQGMQKQDPKLTTIGLLKAYTSEELRSMTDDFSEANILGRGGSSTVYKGSLADGKMVAVKVLKQIKADEGAEGSFIAEAQPLGILKHRNLARVLGFCWSPEIKAFILDYMPNGCLADYIHRKKSSVVLDWETRFNIALGVAHGVHYMHEEFGNPIIHCDLKPANILLDSDFEAHVTDFGISKLVHGNEDFASVSAFKGTIGYVPPEYGSSYRVSTKGDVYSYGILLLEMITGRCSTSEAFGDYGSLREWVLEMDFSEVLDPALLEEDGAHKLEMQKTLRVGLLCTAYTPSSRPTMKEVIAMLMEVKHGSTPQRVLPSIEALANTPSSYTPPPTYERKSSAS